MTSKLHGNVEHCRRENVQLKEGRDRTRAKQPPVPDIKHSDLKQKPSVGVTSNFQITFYQFIIIKYYKYEVKTSSREFLV